jgi:hypothetical protein
VSRASGAHLARKLPSVSSIPPIEAYATKVVWPSSFQFDATIDGKAIEIASTIGCAHQGGVRAGPIREDRYVVAEWMKVTA